MTGPDFVMPFNVTTEWRTVLCLIRQHLVLLKKIIMADLKSSAQCMAAEQKALKILGNIKRVFHYRKNLLVLAFYGAGIGKTAAGVRCPVLVSN